MPRSEQLKEMLEADPDDLFLRYALAMAYVSEGDASAGLNVLGEVIERDPDYVAAYFQKGQILAEQGETDSAREIVTRGIEAARRTGDQHAEGEMSEFLQTL